MTDDKKVGVSSYSKEDVHITGLEGNESDKIQAALRGEKWIRGTKEGRLESVSSFEPLPDPIGDERMLPFWRALPDDEKARKSVIKGIDLDAEAMKNIFSPSIIIQSLCGYNYSPENYRSQANRLESYGFSIMRSKRGADGKFWEIWFLSGLWAAEGELKRRVEENKNWGEEKKLTIALEFLRYNVQFGTLDVVIQRLCQVLD